MFQKRLKNSIALFIFTIMIFSVAASGEVKFDLDYPLPNPGGEATNFYLLPNGNIIVADYEYGSDPKLAPELGGSTSLGAVFMYNGATGELISQLVGSTPGDSIGQDIVILPNNKFLIISRFWNGRRGAITLCSQTVGCNQAISSANSVVGSTPDDYDGGYIRLIGSSYVIVTPSWDGAAVDVGAVRFCNSQIGCAGATSAANALVGTTAVDRIGNTFEITSNLNYIVGSAAWDNGGIVNAGAAVWCTSAGGCAGPVTTANSIHGTATNDNVGLALEPLSNGKYAVISYDWNNGGVPDAGAVTFCNSSFGCTGPVTTANSLHGDSPDDSVGISGVHELPNGAVVTVSPNWNKGSQTRAGSVKYCATTASCVGAITQNNSLVGNVTNDRVGLTGFAVLTNGNYVVSSQTWNNNAGAVTFCDGAIGCIGGVTPSISLVGSGPDSIGEHILVLPNGNYAVMSPGWEAASNVGNIGAATFCNGITGCQNMTVDATNSLIGVTAGDNLGEFNNEVLANGNFVVVGRKVNGGRGSATLCSGTTGCPTGAVDSTNSLVGNTTESSLASGRLLTLDNGNYVVLSPDHDEVVVAARLGTTQVDDVGAATFCNGTTGCQGVADSSNSLVGSSTGDQVGSKAIVSGNNYFIGATSWDNGASIVNAGSVTPCSTSTGCVGPVTGGNSLVGLGANEYLGEDGMFPTAPGDIAVMSPNYNNGAGAAKLGVGGTGAVTYLPGDTTGGLTISEENSVLGTSVDQFFYGQWDPVNNQMVVGRGEDRITTIFRNVIPQRAPFDFDGDGRTDIAQWRSSNGDWYINQSTDGFTGAHFGADGDLLAPADYDGDGKTDLAVWRPAAAGAAAIYILNSTDFSVRQELFGQTGDDPVVVGDWDGDGKADPAVFRDSASGAQSRFYYRGSNNNPGNGITFVDWGTTGDKPVRGDFDGDGIQDAAIFRPTNSSWWVLASSDGSVSVDKFGLADDLLVPADYNGDGKTDIAVFRTVQGNWYILNSSNGSVTYNSAGIGTDTPIPGDYDGDGRADVAVFRPGTQTWYVVNSGDGSVDTQVFGLETDTPVPSSGVTN